MKPASRSATHERIADDAVPYLLRQVAERLGRSLAEAVKPFDQSPSVYRVLIALARRSPARITDLAELTLIEPSTLSRTVDRMESDRLVTRSAGSEDARSVLVSITPEGSAFLDRILPAVSAQYDWSVHDVAPADLEVVRKVLKVMLRNLKLSPIK